VAHDPLPQVPLAPAGSLARPAQELGPLRLQTATGTGFGISGAGFGTFGDGDCISGAGSPGIGRVRVAGKAPTARLTIISRTTGSGNGLKEAGLENEFGVTRHMAGPTSAGASPDGLLRLPPLDAGGRDPGSGNASFPERLPKPGIPTPAVNVPARLTVNLRSLPSFPRRPFKPALFYVRLDCHETLRPRPRPGDPRAPGFWFRKPGGPDNAAAATPRGRTQAACRRTSRRQNAQTPSLSSSRHVRVHVRRAHRSGEKRG
jgi:hypothetical protein